ncbi:MAG: ABC transporter substrate-binding protein [Phycisphaerales bacterium]
MQNKFGLKDFVLMVLVMVVGVLTFMNMKQGDRQWKQNQDIVSKVGSVEQQLAKLERKMQSGSFVASNQNSGGSSRGDTTQAPSDSLRDESWARKDTDAPVEWQPPVEFASSPYDMEGYRLGGEFTEVFEAQPSKLTPVLGEDVYARRIDDLVCETLADFNPETLKLEGTLAEAWQYDPNGYWLRVKLRENIHFSDGVEITAEDVVYSLRDYINNPELETESLRSIMTQIKDATVISEKVVEFEFNEPDAYNLQAALAYYILPKHFYSKLTPAQINQATGLLMGSGPFKLDNLDIDNQWAPGQDVVLVRNEQYWGPKPALGSLRFRTITEDIARLTEFRNGNASMIRPSSPQFTEVSREPGWDEKAYSLNWVNMRSGYSFIGWQCGLRNGKTQTPFHDKRVRQAMTMILDRQLIINDIYDGIGEIATGANNPPSPASNPEVTPWPYDPERAKALLREAGWVDRDNDGILENERGDEFSFEFTRATGGQTIERFQKYLIDQCASVGIRCTPRIVDWSLFDQILKNRDFDAITLGWSASAPESDPKQIWHTDSIQNQGHNFIQWDAGQDEYIDAIKASLDFETRMGYFHELHSLMHEEQPYTFLRVVPWLRFVDKDFKNVHPYPKGIEQREYYYAPVVNN